MDDQQIKELMDKIDQLIKALKEQGKFNYVNIEHADIQGPLVDKLDYNFDKLDVKEVSGALNLGTTFGVKVAEKKKKSSSDGSGSQPKKQKQDSDTSSTTEKKTQTSSHDSGSQAAQAGTQTTTQSSESSTPKTNTQSSTQSARVAAPHSFKQTPSQTHEKTTSIKEMPVQKSQEKKRVTTPVNEPKLDHERPTVVSHQKTSHTKKVENAQQRPAENKGKKPPVQSKIEKQHKQLQPTPNKNSNNNGSANPSETTVPTGSDKSNRGSFKLSFRRREFNENESEGTFTKAEAPLQSKIESVKPVPINKESDITYNGERKPELKSVPNSENTMGVEKKEPPVKPTMNDIQVENQDQPQLNIPFTSTKKGFSFKIK